MLTPFSTFLTAVIFYGDKRFETFRKYLSFLYNIQEMYDMNSIEDLTENEMNDILTIKVCDYDWKDIYQNYQPKYDKTSDSFILQKYNEDLL
jgi:hypothetical protein